MTVDAGHNDDEDMRPDCTSCSGLGYFDIGDPEDGVIDECPACNGTGKELQGDEFIPERDAFTPND